MAGAVDVAGNPRIVFDTVDMGAYEYIVSLNDYDGDGLENDAEAIADTDATDPSSKLAIVGIALTNSIQVTWKGGSQARQFLEIKSDLLSTAEQWSAIWTNEPDTPITNFFVHPSATNGTLFYRIRAEDP